MTSEKVKAYWKEQGRKEAQKETAEKVQKLKAELHINHNFHDLDFVDSIFGGKA